MGPQLCRKRVSLYFAPEASGTLGVQRGAVEARPCDRSFKYALATSPSRCTRGRRLEALTSLLSVCVCFCCAWLSESACTYLSPFLSLFYSPLFCRLRPQGDGSTVHPLTSFWGSHSSLVKPRARQSVSTRAVVTTTGIQGIWLNSGAARLHCCPLHKCLQITRLTSHASHTAALSDGVVAVSVRTCRDQIWITTVTLHFRSGFGPGCAGWATSSFCRALLSFSASAICQYGRFPPTINGDGGLRVCPCLHWPSQVSSMT